MAMSHEEPARPSVVVLVGPGIEDPHLGLAAHGHRRDVASASTYLIHVGQARSVCSRLEYRCGCVVTDRVAVKATMRAGFGFVHPQSVVKVATA